MATIRRVAAIFIGSVVGVGIGLGIAEWQLRRMYAPKEVYRPYWSTEDYTRMDSGKPALNPPRYERFDGK